MNIMTAAAYARYSTDGQTENSIAYQMHEITGYCRQHNIQLTHSFVDEGMSGTNTDRGGFQDMVSAAQRQEFTDIIIYDVTRGSRDVADWFRFRKHMREFGVNVISCKQDLGDPLDPNDFLRELLTVGLGQHSVLETRQKVLDGVASAARAGKFLGGWAPFGYEIVRDNTIKGSRYSIVPSEAAIVRKAFELYAAGFTYNYILDQLHLRGVVGRHGKTMSANSLYYMFKNQRYAGTYIWNEYTFQCMRKYIGRKENSRMVKIDDAIPAIVDKETFEKVQERLQINKSRCTRASKRRVFLLTGLIQCAVCGAGYIAHQSRSKGKEYTYYCCSGRYGKKNKPDSCQSSPARGEDLEKFVIEAVKQYLVSGTDFEALAQQVADRFSAASVDVSAEKNELSGIDTKIANGVQAILSGFDAPELRQQIEQLKMRKAELQTVIGSAEQNRRRIDVPALAAMLRADVENLDSQDDEVVRAAIRRHVPFITANEDGSFTVSIGYTLNKKARKKTPLSEENEVARSMAGADEAMSNVQLLPSAIILRQIVYRPAA